MDALHTDLDAALDWAGMAAWESSVSEDCLVAGLIDWTAAGAALVGMPGPGRHPFSAFLDRLHIDDRPRVLNELGRGRRGPLIALEFRLLAPGQAARRMALRAVLGMTANGSPDRALGILWDTAWIVPVSGAAPLEQTPAGQVLAAIPLGIVATDADACITYMNPAAERMSGRHSRAAVGGLIHQALHLLGADGSAQHDCAVLRCLRAQHAVDGQSDCVLETQDGRLIVIEQAAAPILADDGAVAGAVLSFRDVSHERKLKQQLSWKATHDALTGLLNRAEFESRLGAACHSAQAEGQEHALLYMDLDRFKIVNDTCGHCAGDLLLQQLTKTLLAHMRDSDTLARLGGDELGVLLLHCPLEKAHRVAESLRQAVGNFRFSWETHVFQLGISIGITGVNADCALASEMLSEADEACYIAKQNGRNCIHLHQLSDATHVLRQGRQGWVSTLKNAFIRDDFRLYAMPVATLRDGGASHEEILVRLSSAVGELLLPASFLPAAERYDLMASIDRWVVAAVCRFLQQRQQRESVHQAAAPAPVLCSVNLSHASLGDPDFAGYVAARFREYGVAPSQFCFEIDEAELNAAPHAVHGFVDALHGAGCHFALDNFSGAFGSFIHLKCLPVSFLKIHGILVRGTATDPLHRVLVRAINEVAHAMGIKTVAGHVENAAILAAIDAIGIDYAQGFAVGPARPLGEAPHWRSIGA